MLKFPNHHFDHEMKMLITISVASLFTRSCYGFMHRTCLKGRSSRNDYHVNVGKLHDVWHVYIASLNQVNVGYNNSFPGIQFLPDWVKLLVPWTFGLAKI